MSNGHAVTVVIPPENRSPDPDFGRKGPGPGGEVGLRGVLPRIVVRTGEVAPAEASGAALPGGYDGGRGDRLRPSPSPLAVSVREAARMIGVCARTLAREAMRGELRTFRIGRAVRVRVAELEAYLARKEAESARKN